MNIAAIFSLLLTILKLAKTYWPVITAGVVLISKVFTGDQSGVSEAVSMVLSAWASINSGAKTAKAVQSMESRTVAVAIGPKLGPLQSLHPTDFVIPRAAPDFRPDHPLIR